MTGAPPVLAPTVLGLLERLDSHRRDLLRVACWGTVHDAERFARQVEHLARSTWRIASVAQVLEALDGGHALPQRAVLPCFLELAGFRERALPALVRHRVPALLLVRPAAAADVARELDELARAGVSIGLHADPRGELARAFELLDAGASGLPRVVLHGGT